MIRGDSIKEILLKIKWLEMKTRREVYMVWGVDCPSGVQAGGDKVQHWGRHR
jgi:hypothetical protein